MTFVILQPQAIEGAASDVAEIGSAIREAHAAAAGATTSVLAAARDEVSVAISKLFGIYGQEYQALAGQTALFHDQFVQALTASSNAYGATEAASTESLLASDVQRADAIVISDLKTAISDEQSRIAVLLADLQSADAELSLEETFLAALAAQRAEQLREFELSVVSASNNALASLARNIKG